MNFVDFDSETRDLLVSPKLWVYFVIAIPLTVATLVGWRRIMQSYKANRPFAAASSKVEDDGEIV